MRQSAEEKWSIRHSELEANYAPSHSSGGQWV